MEYTLSEENYFSVYGKTKKKNLVFIFFSLFLLLIVFLISCSIGDFNISPISILSKNLSEKEKYIFFNIRLLRGISGILAGSGLALTGAVIQNILKNPMASPFTLGISQGAAFGASFAIIFLGAGFTFSYGEAVMFSSFPVTVLFAFLGAILASGFISFVAYIKGGQPYTVLLSGVACGAFFQAMTMFIQYFAEDVKVAAALFWSFGDISKADWKAIFIISIFLFVVLIFFLFSAKKLNALLWGKEIAYNLGVNVKDFMIISILLVSALISVITAFMGVIGFIGLIAPHLARFFVGDDNRYFLPLSAIFGAIVLIVSDIISRSIIPPSVIPVGIITSFWGIAVLIYLFLKRNV